LVIAFFRIIALLAFLLKLAQGVSAQQLPIKSTPSPMGWRATQYLALSPIPTASFGSALLKGFPVLTVTGSQPGPDQGLPSHQVRDRLVSLGAKGLTGSGETSDCK
jgi:hypothetical protein